MMTAADWDSDIYAMPHSITSYGSALPLLPPSPLPSAKLCSLADEEDEAFRQDDMNDFMPTTTHVAHKQDAQTTKAAADGRLPAHSL